MPADGGRFAYICTGTWSLVGVELDAPVLSDASRDANFTNEVGVDGTIRYLRNVMGLWLLQECQRAWGEPDAGRLLAAAEHAPPFAAIVDPDDPTSSRPATCRRGSTRTARAPVSRRRSTGPATSGASWRAWRSRTGPPSATPSGCPGATSTSCTSSAAERATRCCAS